MMIENSRLLEADNVRMVSNCQDHIQLVVHCRLKLVGSGELQCHDLPDDAQTTVRSKSKQASKTETISNLLRAS